MNRRDRPVISVIMVDGSFREKFHALDFFSRQTFMGFELLWVEYYDKVDPQLQRKLACQRNFRSITLDRSGVYHSSYCFNAGIRASTADLLVIADGDVAVEIDFLQRVWDEHAENEKLVMYVHRHNEPGEHHAPEINLEHLRAVTKVTNPENYGGCLTVRKKWLLAINGYEQHWVFGQGEHANGRDVYTRMKNLGLDIQWHPELKLYHPWHTGTLAAASSYRLQQIVIDFRARSLATSAFEGLDPSRNSAPPSDLIARIETEQASIADSTRSAID